MKNLILIIISVFIVNIFLFQKNTFAADVELYTKVIYPTFDEIVNKEMKSTCNSYTDHLLIRDGSNETMIFEQNDPIVSAIVQCGVDPMWHKDPIVHYDASPGDIEMFTNADGTPLQFYSVKAKCAFVDEGDNDSILGYQAPAQLILICIDHKSIDVPEKK